MTVCKMTRDEKIYDRRTVKKMDNLADLIKTLKIYLHLVQKVLVLYTWATVIMNVILVLYIQMKATMVTNVRTA